MFHAHLVGGIRIDIIRFQYTLLEYRKTFRGNTLAIEITCAGSLYQMRLIYQGHLVARYLLVDLIQQERVLLLDGGTINGSDYWRKQTTGVHVIHDHGIFTGRHFPLSQFSKHPFQRFRTDTGLHQLVIIQGRVVPIRLGTGVTLPTDADTPHQAIRGTRSLAFETVAGYHVLKVLFVAVGSVGGDDPVVLAHDFLTDAHGQRYLVVRLHGVEIRVDQSQVRRPTFIIQGSVRQRASLVLGEETSGGDTILDELLQLFLIQAIGRVGAVTAVHEQMNHHAVLGRLLQTVYFHIPYLKRTAGTIVKRDT